MSITDKYKRLSQGTFSYTKVGVHHCPKHESIEASVWVRSEIDWTVRSRHSIQMSEEGGDLVKDAGSGDNWGKAEYGEGLWFTMRQEE